MKYICVLITLYIYFRSYSAKFVLESEILTRRFTNYLSQFNQMKIKNLLIINKNIPLIGFGAVYYDEKKKNYMLSDKELKKKHLKIISKAIFHKTLMTKGWDKLSVETYKYANPFLQTYFAGYLEGRMTANDIYNFYNNIRVNNKPNAIDFENMRKFFKSVNMHISKKLSEFPNMKKNDKEFWSKLILGYSQLKGLKNGYNFEILRNGGKNKTLEIEDFLIIQSDGEIPELLSYYKLKKDISVIQEKRLNLMTRTSLN